MTNVKLLGCVAAIIAVFCSSTQGVDRCSENLNKAYSGHCTIKKLENAFENYTFSVVARFPKIQRILEDTLVDIYHRKRQNANVDLSEVANDLSKKMLALGIVLDTSTLPEDERVEYPIFRTTWDEYLNMPEGVEKNCRGAAWVMEQIIFRLRDFLFDCQRGDEDSARWTLVRLKNQKYAADQMGYGRKIANHFLEVTSLRKEECKMEKLLPQKIFPPKMHPPKTKMHPPKINPPKMHPPMENLK